MPPPQCSTSYVETPQDSHRKPEAGGFCAERWPKPTQSMAELQFHHVPQGLMQPSCETPRVAMTAPLALVKIYHYYYDDFFMSYQNFPCYSLWPLLLDFVFHERALLCSTKVHQSKEKKTQEHERHSHSLAMFT